MVALLKSQRFDNKIDQNKQLLIYFLFFDNYFEILNLFLAKNS